MKFYFIIYYEVKKNEEQKTFSFAVREPKYKVHILIFLLHLVTANAIKYDFIILVDS